MMREVQGIPPAPRRVRLRTLLAFRWPLLAIGLALTVYGGIFTWMLFLAAGAKPSDQARLDQGPTALAKGTVTRVEPPFTTSGRTMHRVHYRFVVGEQELPGASFTAADRHAVQDEIDVEYLPSEPNRNRIVGSSLHVWFDWLQPGCWFGAMVVPGALLLLGWLAGVFQLRSVLVHGDVSVAEVQSVRRLPYVLPEMLSVRYTFRDHRAKPRSGAHWVRAHSRLGERLERQLVTGFVERLPVLHDRRQPQWNRLLSAQDFQPSQPGVGSRETSAS